MSYFGPGDTPLNPDDRPLNDVENDVLDARLRGDVLSLATADDVEPEDTALYETYDIEGRLIRIEAKLERLTEGVNTIGGMMNGVAKAFDDIMTKINEGGIAGLLGGMMGGKK